jgi:hypothetical protein
LKRGEKIDCSFEEYSKNNHNHTIGYRLAVYERDHYSCAYCGEDEEILEVHHIIPLKDNGTNDLGNLVLLCYECHLKAHGGSFRKMVKTGKTGKNVGFYIPFELLEDIEEYCRKTGVKKSPLIQLALKEFFKKNLHIEK